MIIYGSETSFQQPSEILRKLGIVPASAVPVGGATGQVLTKFSGADYDFGWSTILGGIITAGNGIVFAGNTVHFAQSAAFTAGRTPYCASGTTIGFDSRYWFWDAANGYLGYGTEAPLEPLDVRRVSADLTKRNYFNFTLELTAVSATTRRSLRTHAFTTGSDVYSTGLIAGFYAAATADGSGTSPGPGIRYTAAEFYHGKELLGTGNVGATCGLFIQPENLNATGAVALTYDIYLATPLATGTITDSCGLYQQSALMWNYLAGSLGISTGAAPVARLDINSVTTGWARAVKLQPGDLGTDDSGAYIEFASSITDAYGAQIGGIRENPGSGGLNALVFKTGTNAQAERLRITDAGHIRMVNASGLNYSAGFMAFGSTSPVNTTFALFGAGTTAVSSLRIVPGVAPTSPVSGDIWSDGTDLYWRDAGGTSRKLNP